MEGWQQSGGWSLILTMRSRFVSRLYNHYCEKGLVLSVGSFHFGSPQIYPGISHSVLQCTHNEVSMGVFNSGWTSSVSPWYWVWTSMCTCLWMGCTTETSTISVVYKNVLPYKDTLNDMPAHVSQIWNCLCWGYQPTQCTTKVLHELLDM